MKNNNPSSSGFNWVRLKVDSIMQGIDESLCRDDVFVPNESLRPLSLGKMGEKGRTIDLPSYPKISLFIRSTTLKICFCGKWLYRFVTSKRLCPNKIPISTRLNPDIAI